MKKVEQNPNCHSLCISCLFENYYAVSNFIIVTLIECEIEFLDWVGTARIWFTKSAKWHFFNFFSYTSKTKQYVGTVFQDVNLSSDLTTLVYLTCYFEGLEDINSGPLP